MTSTALGAGVGNTQQISFISDAHEKFYYEKLNEVRYQDVYNKAQPVFIRRYGRYGRERDRSGL